MRHECLTPAPTEGPAVMVPLRKQRRRVITWQATQSLNHTSHLPSKGGTREVQESIQRNEITLKRPIPPAAGRHLTIESLLCGCLKSVRLLLEQSAQSTANIFSPLQAVERITTFCPYYRSSSCSPAFWHTFRSQICSARSWFGCPTSSLPIR